MGTASEASCGPRTTLTLSSPAKAEEGVGTLLKVLAGERIQKVATDKLCDVDFAIQASISKQSALKVATEAEVLAQAHQPPSPD